MNKDELKLLQNYPLELKIEKTKLRIREWYEHYNGEVYVSFSGGKDSTVLLHIVRSLYPDVEAVYFNTGVEYPEVVKFVKTFDNVTIVKPKMTFKQIIEEKGYPIVSKNVANAVRLGRQNLKDGKDTLRLRQLQGRVPAGDHFDKSRWGYLLDAPFKISEECCNELKKKPAKEFHKKTGKYPMMATMAEEGSMRTQRYLQTGCNSFKNGKSQPLGFWTEQDVLEYIVKYNLEIPSVYGDIIKVKKNGKEVYKTTKLRRTGCIFCGFGCHVEPKPNRFQVLKETHPNLYKYCMDKLNMKEVLDYINVKY